MNYLKESSKQEDRVSIGTNNFHTFLNKWQDIYGIIPKGNIGYDQYTVPDTVAVRSTLRPWPLVPFFPQFLWRTLNSKPPTIPFVACTFSDKRVSMGWCLLRLSAKILAVLRLSVNFFQLRLTKKLISFVSKSLINLHFQCVSSKQNKGLRIISGLKMKLFFLKKKVTFDTSYFL